MGLGWSFYELKLQKFGFSVKNAVETYVQKYITLLESLKKSFLKKRWFTNPTPETI